MVAGSTELARKEPNTPANVQQKTAIGGKSAAESGAVLDDSGSCDSMLRRLVERWPGLGDAVRERIVALADLEP